VDQNDIGFLAGQRLEPRMHRGLTRRAAIGRRLMAQARDRFVEDRGIIGVHNRLHGKDIGVAAERFHRPEDHGLSADRTVLLGPAGAGAKPAPGCDENGCCTLRFRHLTQLRTKRSEEGIGPLRRTALTMPNAQKQSDSRKLWEK